MKLLFSFKIKEFIKYTDLIFLIVILSGAVLSVFSLAYLLGYLFENYPVYVWAFFFGLILASVYFVGKTIDNYNFSTIAMFLIGTAAAIAISILNPASENSSFFYLIICGVVAICSMILPGLSGSFVLILMGNYKLVMIDAVSNVNISVLVPVAIGAAGGLVIFSHLLSWVYKKYKNQTLGILTGFILGSLMILWPWKETTYLKNEQGELLIKEGEKIISGYRQVLPDSFNQQVIWAIIFMLIGVITIWGIEKLAEKQEN
jgi:putative membrane protein